MKAAVYSIMKGGPDSAVASVRLARYVAETLKLPLHSGRSIAEEGRLDLGIVINGPMLYAMTGKKETVKAFTDFMLKTKHLIWVQNDYTIYAPADKDHSKAEAGFRHDFAQRKEPLHYWTTCEKQQDRTEGSSYVNWNMLTYEPHKLVPPKERKAFYYGALRGGRDEAFKRFLDNNSDVVVSSVSKKFGEEYTIKHLIPAMKRDEFYPTLQRYALGLYLADRRSNREYHSPANRFYEMLGAGLPMLFQPENREMMAKAGYTIDSYLLSGPKDLRNVLGKPGLIKVMQADQAKKWRRDYRKELDAQVKAAWKKTLKAIK